MAVPRQAAIKGAMGGHTNLGSNPNDTDQKWSIPTPPNPDGSPGTPGGLKGIPGESSSRSLQSRKAIGKRAAIGKGGRGGSPRDMIQKAAQRRLMSS